MFRAALVAVAIIPAFVDVEGFLGLDDRQREGAE